MFQQFIELEEKLSAISLIGEGLTNNVDILGETIFLKKKIFFKFFFF